MEQDSNVIPFPGNRIERKISGSAEAAAHLRKRFREGGRGQHETFVVLGTHTFNLIKELKADFGERSGKMQRAFGDLLKQKQRFIVAQHEAPGTLCQNPANWEQVLRGLAVELGRDPDRAFLDAMRGSPLLPRPEENRFGRQQWLPGFHDLMSRLAGRLTASVDYSAIATWLADSGLIVEDGRLQTCEGESDATGIEDYGLYTPAALFSVPHVLGLNYRCRVEDAFDPGDAGFEKFLKDAGLPLSLGEGETEAVLRGGTRTAIALVIDATTGAPTIALPEWEVLELVFNYQSTSERSHPIYKSYAEIGHEEISPDVQSPNSVRFNLLGSPGFDTAASSHIVFPEIWTDRPDYELWDPGGSAATAQDFPTEVPARTVAAVIERNLSYAAPANIDRRIDSLLLPKLHQLQALIGEHRSATLPLARVAKQGLVAGWQAVPVSEDGL
jgi:hypothetical protein